MKRLATIFLTLVLVISGLIATPTIIFSQFQNHEGEKVDEPIGPSADLENDAAGEVETMLGPQVNDPRAPEWAAHVERHIELWRRVVDHCRTNGLATLAITPEFGPHPYVPTLPYTVSPVVDVWEVNVFMKDMLRYRLAPHRR